MMKIFIVFLYALITTAALSLTKFGSNQAVSFYPINKNLGFNLNTFSLIGIMLFGVSFIIWLYLVARSDLSYIVPLTAGLVYLLTSLAGFYFFNETFSLLKIAGMILIFFGLIFLSLNK